MTDITTDKILTLITQSTQSDGISLSIDKKRITKNSIVHALNSQCTIKHGEFWEVVIPRTYPFVIKHALKPSADFLAMSENDSMLLARYIPIFIPIQTIITSGTEILLIQEKVVYPFQVSSGSFKTTFNSDLLFLRTFLKYSARFRQELVKFLSGIESMHHDTGKIIDLWGSNNLIFTAPWSKRPIMLIDTNFLFWHIEKEEEAQSQNGKKMNQGYHESISCFSRLQELIKYE